MTFAEARPDLAIYYKPELNNGKLMSELKAGSAKRIDLCCPVCNIVKNVMIRRYTIPTPAGTDIGFKCIHCNSLGACYPEVAKEWHPLKNGSVTPFDVAKSSGRIRVWWKCENGHEWQATINNRTFDGNRCAMCSHKLSKGEKIVADWFDEMKIEYVAQFHVRINNSTRYFDFYLPEEQIFIEIHGLQHFEDVDFYSKGRLKNQQKVDKQKREYAEANGKYIMVDYREHKPELTLERFIDQMAELT